MFGVSYRQAFASLERDYLSWIDECLTQQVQNMNMNMNQNRNSIEQFQVCIALFRYSLIDFTISKKNSNLV